MSTITIHRLLALVNNAIHQDYAEYVWKRLHDRDTDKASNWLLDNLDNLPDLERQWREIRKDNRTITDRYTSCSASIQNVPPTPYQPMSTSTTNVRYLHGEVVSHKGERYIMQKDNKEEWDGGSRGKVKTKGKRGKGFA